MPTRMDIEKVIRSLLVRYHAEYALLFGSYARGEETPDSDIDLVVFGGDNFKKSNPNYSCTSETASANGCALSDINITDTLQSFPPKKGALLPWGSDNF